MADEDAISEIKKNLGTDKIVIGADRTIKLLKQGALKSVFVAKNAPVELKDDIKRYSGISDVSFVELDITNEELAVICRKPFNVAVISVMR